MAKWNTLGEFAAAVRRAFVDKYIDPRLGPQAAAPATQSQEAQGADGGYLVPPDFRTDVTQKVLGEESLLARCDLQRTTSNSLTVPGDESAPWAAAGVQPGIEGEGSTLNQTKVKVTANTLRLAKISALIPVTDELLADSAALGSYLSRAAGDKLSYLVDSYLISGDGVQKPLGLLNAPAKVMQTKESGQTAATVNLANTQKMLARLHAAARQTAVWLAHPEVEPQLSTLGYPHWNPAGPTPLLHGLPVLFREACSALGTEGDLVLWSPKGYLAAVRAQPNGANDVRLDASLHLWFDYDLAALRFTMRVGGAPWLSAPFTRAKTATTISTIVSLEAR